MDSSMFNDLWKGVAAMIVLLMLGSAACGACVAKYAGSFPYTIKIERK